MSAHIAAYGRLGGDPKSINTSSGNAMAVASIAVDVQERGAEDPPPEWLGVVAFGGQADKLLQHDKGECIAVSGRVQRNRWTGQDGNERVQLQVIADSLVSARTVRPGKRKQQQTDEQPAGEPEPAAAGEDFNDEIPF